ncbi:hypothetical protein ACQPZ2_30645 [Nocardia pseudovaccinii]|uniref:hypothetical protein n=1 Tax=Nocardia pseudovaccinii TaxID=189540 RepID=UPI003D8CD879
MISVLGGYDVAQVLDVLIDALVVGLVVGLVFVFMQEPAWFGFVVTTRWLALKGRLPWRTHRFLDDAHRLGLLRTAGAVYQFRHAELQDHLAHTEQN